MQRTYKHTPKTEKGSIVITDGIQVHGLPTVFICFSNIISKEVLRDASEKVNRRMYLILEFIMKQSSNHRLLVR